ncbi:unnamed protein product [Malus baccata var. baccata]
MPPHATHMGLKTMMGGEEDYSNDGGGDGEVDEEEENGIRDEEVEEADELNRAGCTALAVLGHRIKLKGWNQLIPRFRWG